jgi:predicted TIM-barrel fold metal-dependent hydrolase
MSTAVVSADDHVIEPRSFWDEWLPEHLPPADRARAPRRVGPGLALEGESSAPLRTFLLFPELVERSDAADGASDVAGRVATLDRDGIDVSLVFPQRAMAMWGMQDRTLMRRCFDAYNLWLAQWTRSSDGRVHGVPILATVYEPEATGDYIAWLRDLGFRTFLLPNYPRGRSYADPEMAPLWRAIESSGLPVNFHISEAPDDNGPGGLGTYLAVSFQPFRKLWAFLVFSGILDSHPDLRVVFTEGGISWVPSALDHADRIHREFAGHLEPRLPMPPSHYWATQCYATFMDDPRGLEQVEHIGVDRILWSSDYPHPEGTFPATDSARERVRTIIGPTAAVGVLGATATKLYGLRTVGRAASDLPVEQQRRGGPDVL